MDVIFCEFVSISYLDIVDASFKDNLELILLLFFSKNNILS